MMTMGARARKGVHGNKVRIPGHHRKTLWVALEIY